MKDLSVFQQKEKDLKHTMRRCRIFEKDIKESFVRSSGPGGQNVNKVSTCVVLVHVPTGIHVKCQEGRTQAINRHKARFLLVRKIEEQIHQEKLQLVQTKEKLRRQKRKRPKHLKEEVLKSKHKQSEKKQARKKVKPYKLDDN